MVLLADYIVVDFDGARVKVITEMTNWPPRPIRRACINSFGYGGANAHCILDHVTSVVPGYQLRGLIKIVSPGLNGSYHSRQNAEQKAVSGMINGHMLSVDNDINTNEPTGTDYPTKTNSLANGYCHKTNIVTNANEFSNTNGNLKSHELHVGSTPELVESTRPGTRSLVLLPFSGHDNFSLEANISVMADAIKEQKLADLAYTLSSRRSRFFQRAFAVVESESPSAALNINQMTCGKSTGSQVQRVCFIFTGMSFD